MAKLPCGCEFTDRRPGGNFLLFAGDTLLGSSELEYEDAADGVWLRRGPFQPAATYYQFQELFQRQTRLSRPAERDRHRMEIQTLEQQIQALRLRLVHSDGMEIPVVVFRLDDCSDTLTKDPRELWVEIRERIVHDRFFSQPVA